MKFWSLRQRRNSYLSNFTQKGYIQIGDPDLPRDVTPKAGTCPSISCLPSSVALYLDKGIPPVCSLCDVQGPGDVFSTDGDCVLDQTVSESLVLHLGRQRDCMAPVQQSLAWDSHLFLVPLATKDPLLVGNALDQNQAHEGHSLGIMSTLCYVYG